MPRAKYVSKSFTEIDMYFETDTFFICDVKDFSGYNINLSKWQMFCALELVVMLSNLSIYEDAS